MGPIEQMAGIVWIVILIVMVIIEIITLGLTTIWFAGGALVAFIAGLLGAGIPLQVTLFVVVSLGLLAGTRPFAVKFFNKDRVRTNSESLIGATAIVLEDIDNLHATGQVQVNGLEWMARSADDTWIGKGKEVLVQEIRGVKLIVKEKEKMEE